MLIQGNTWTMKSTDQTTLTPCVDLPPHIVSLSMAVHGSQLAHAQGLEVNLMGILWPTATDNHSTSMVATHRPGPSFVTVVTAGDLFLLPLSRPPACTYIHTLYVHVLLPVLAAAPGRSTPGPNQPPARSVVTNLCSNEPFLCTYVHLARFIFPSRFWHSFSADAGSLRVVV